MGQQTSAQNNYGRTASNEKRQLSSNADIIKIFNHKALEQFTVVELIAFKSKINSKELSAAILDEELTRWLHLPYENLALRETFYNFIRVLSNFPLMKDSFENVTGTGLLKAIALINHDRCKRYVGSKNYDQLKLFFIALSLKKTIKEESGTPSSTSSEELHNMDNAIKNYNSIDVEELTIPAESLLQVLAFLLLLSKYCSTNNCQFPPKAVFEEWGLYKNAAMRFLRSMDSDIASHPESHYITYQQFTKTIKTIIPNIFQPLERLVEHMLYQECDLVPHLEESVCNLTHSKSLTQVLLTQLATAIPKEMEFSKLQKLYVGRESGFSMRSLQAKVFKWMAPTILLVIGKPILNDNEYCTKNPRYRKFLQEYPKLKDDDQNLSDLHLQKNKAIFAVYIAEPWKITNKEYFGGPGTTIVQLSPRQDIFKASKNDVVYFNTIGGGIGIGNKQPKIKTATKSYAPGNVSLTLDNTLEFATFRHIGYGGALSPGLLLTKNHMEDRSFEIRLLVQEVEVWGCGGERELEEQHKKWEWEEAEAKRRQQINLRSMGEDRALLEMAGIIGQAQSGGSM